MQTARKTSSTGTFSDCRVCHNYYYLRRHSGFSCQFVIYLYSFFSSLVRSASLFLPLVHFAALAAWTPEDPTRKKKKSPNSARGGGERQPRHFSAAPAHLPSPSRLFPFSPRGHQLQQSAEIFPREPEREGAESMKRSREGGRLRKLMVECSCSTFKARTDRTPWVLMAPASILIRAYFTFTGYTWAWQHC